MFRAGRRVIRPAGGLLLAASGAFVAAAALGAVPRDAPPRLLGGDLMWSDSLDKSWPRCGPWMYPVGDSLDPGRAPADGSPQFRATRGLIRGGRRSPRHDGADLSNRRSGDDVRAAARGLVVHVDTTSTSDYGVHAVVAHRLEDGDVVVSVYAHLEPATLRVTPGATVHPGQVIGRVGSTGRTSSPHLHFEVRRPRTLTDSWLLAPPVDPMTFIASRLPGPEDSAWSSVYLAWAEGAGLIPRGQRGADTLTHAIWQRMLLACSAVPAGADPREWVAGEGGSDRPAEPAGATLPVSWNELARDLTRLANSRRRLTPCPVQAADHRRRCASALDVRHPVRSPHRLAARPASPTVAETCLILADLTVGAPRRSRKR